jgi:MYND finger
MAPIRTFELTLPMEPKGGTITCALGTLGPNVWLLVRTSPSLDDYDVRECSSIAVRATEDEHPALSADGNPVIALKNYSENKGYLELLEAAGVIRHTGRRIFQGFVQLEMVEILIPMEELIKHCGACGVWEKVDEQRFLRCSRCKSKHYCSSECQKDNWKEHKKLCKEGMTEAEVLAAQTALEKTSAQSVLEDMGFRTISPNQ